MTDITWNKNGDDYSAIVGEYKIEVLFSPIVGWYIWALFLGTRILSMSSKHEPLLSVGSAKEAAVKAYKDYVKKS